jgi:hypothetical protein
MEQISRFPSLVARGLFLRTDAYEEMRGIRRPVLNGLALIVLVGVIIALAGLVGTLLEWASSPDPKAVQVAVYEGLIEMPWYRQQIQMMPGFADQFKRWYDLGWTILDQVVVPNPLSAAGNIVLIPLGLTVNWLIYGLLAHFFARLLQGQASLGQTLGFTALAVAPNLLRVAEVIPFVSVGGVVGTWVLISRYVALKQAHHLTWGRALGATLLPLLVLGLLGLILAGIGLAIGGTLARQLLGGALQ